MSPPLRVVVTGGTGFIGSAALRELARSRGSRGTDVGPLVIRALGRREPDRSLADEWAYADLARPETLEGACSGADVLLHLASFVGSDPDRCERVNALGTAALMEDAVRCGIERVVHLSTAAVYGPGPHRGITVEEGTPAPVSAVSRSRLAGEAHALAAGADVLRTGLVVGEGDRWVVPAVAKLFGAVPGLWDGGRARVSMVAVEDLARLVVALAGTERPSRNRVFHACHPAPLSCGELLRGLARLELLPSLPEVGELSWQECLRRLRFADCGVSERQFAFVARDNWFDSEDVWRVAGCSPGHGPLRGIEEAAPWYRSLISPRTVTS
ncbi:NAD(P)-dependent oxidoreductase [Streptomyces sp. AD681]|uniref:NAD-dependent epimerase/dehydratase family protein n=1 Tax=Streptomyces sp. AD681 TaxID=3019069 RepID=UPI0022F16121|nr:NAD(P)-dependent oxidoreductase [Streptomyces sp. AD681]MDA5145931.1 NAD(P)-dependent oxidoreductase [Streptomyces sp. AD681]